MDDALGVGGRKHVEKLIDKADRHRRRQSQSVRMHRFRFTVSGRPPVEESILIKQGEKNRELSVAMGDGVPKKEPAADTRAPGEIAGTAEQPRAAASSGQRIAAIVTGSAGLVALGFGVGVGLMAIDTYHTAQNQCGSGCASNAPAQQILGDARTQAAVSSGLFIGGAVALAAGVVLWLLAPRAHAHSAASLGALRWTF